MEELIIPQQPKEIHPLKHMFVSDEIAKELHRIGFNEPCFAYYTLSHTGDDYGFYVVGEYTHYRDFYSNYVGHGLSNSELQRNPTGRLKQCFVAPLYQQVINWLRTKYSLWIHVADACGGNGCYYSISHGKNGGPDNFIKSEKIYTDYNEALTDAILYGLKLIRMNEFIVSNIKL